MQQNTSGTRGVLELVSTTTPKEYVDGAQKESPAELKQRTVHVKHVKGEDQNTHETQLRQLFTETYGVGQPTAGKTCKERKRDLIAVA